MDNWNENSLIGEWIISKKIDGVKMLRDDSGSPISRAGKPLYNLDDVPRSITEAEIYTGSWESSITAVRTMVADKVPIENVYSLEPLDSRLFICKVENPHSDYIKALMEEMILQGYEGLVLKQGVKYLKVKPSYTYDVVITKVIEGKGKHIGRLGAVMTPMGKVGTGFTNAERNIGLQIGTMIEVKCMGLTPSGKFRHPVFVRIREDKLPLQGAG